MKLLFLLLLLSVPAFTQKPLEPIRVSLSVQGQTPQEFEKLLRAALNSRRNVVISEKRPEYQIFVSVAPLDEDSKCDGYVGAMLVIDATGAHTLSVHTGGNVKRLAAHLVLRMNERLFQRK